MKKILLLSGLLFSAIQVFSTGDACSNTTDGTINKIECDDVGSAAFDAAANLIFTSSATGGTNSPSSYGATGGNGTCEPSPNAYSEWHHYDLEDGVDAIFAQWDLTNGSICNGFSTLNATFYQGTDCNNLVLVDCALMLSKNKGPGYGVYNFSAFNLDSDQDLWIYFAGGSAKCFTNFGFNVFGTGQPDNSDCSTAASDPANGCNVGAYPETWGGPNTIVGPESAWAGGTTTTCLGTSNWTSNENTVYYEVQAPADLLNASVQITGVTCNNGVTGDAQVAVVDGCACFDNSGYVNDACFLGCAIGTSTIQFDVLAGETFIIAVDGFAGDLCKWDFTYVGIEPLASNDIYVSASIKGEFANIKWSVDNNEQASHFNVERSNPDGTFSVIKTIQSNESSNYSYTDDETIFLGGSVFYKVNQINNNGEVLISKLVTLNFTSPDEPIFTFHNNNVKVKFFERFKKQEYSINIYNNVGQLVKQELVSADSGASFVDIDASTIGAGVFYVVIRNQVSQEGYSYKFLK